VNRWFRRTGAAATMLAERRRDEGEGIVLGLSLRCPPLHHLDAGI
jgi:hypothetical protein